MNLLINMMTRFGLLKDDLDYHLIRASMVIIFLFFGYQKWFEYEAQALIPYISNGPLISWLYPVFGIRGATWFLGVAEWTFGGLLLLRPRAQLPLAPPVIREVSTHTIEVVVNPAPNGDRRARLRADNRVLLPSAKHPPRHRVPFLQAR